MQAKNDEDLLAGLSFPGGAAPPVEWDIDCQPLYINIVSVHKQAKWLFMDGR